VRGVKFVFAGYLVVIVLGLSYVATLGFLGR
jgi:hypothetical protein